jgi:glycerol-3-phosphate dehydrogenase
VCSFQRNFQRLGQETYDLLIIGGGINGLGIAWDAALRGWKVALVEKSDFGGETSAGCFKILHGGLRYLQQLDFPRIFKSLHEQRVLRALAPHLFRPLPFLVPCYGYGKKSREVLELGLRMYELLGCRRNSGVPPELRLPNHLSLSSDEVLREAPGLPANGLRGGAVFYDAQMLNCERLSLAVARSAADAGACLCNYARAVAADISDSGARLQVDSVQVQDVLSGEQVPVRSRFVVNAAGPWVDQLWGTLFRMPVRAPRRFVRGVQFVLPPIAGKYSLAVESPKQDGDSFIQRGGRAYFLVPWQGMTLAGTYEAPEDEPERGFRPRTEDIDTFFAELSSAYRSEFLSRKHLCSVFGGLIPLEPKRPGDDAGRHRVCRDDELVLPASDHGGPENVLSVRGVKYTTFRALAEKTVDALERQSGRATGKSRTAETKVNGGRFESRLQLTEHLDRSSLGSLPAEKRQSLFENYGSNIAELWNRAEEDPQLLAVVGSSNVTRLEISYAVECEMALRLSDVLRRRTNLAAVGRVDDATLEAASEYMAELCNWTEKRRNEELTAVRQENYR